MTVKPFNIRDLGAFVPNAYSSPDEIFPLFMDERYNVKTLWGKDGLVKAIICFWRYWGDCWGCFVLISQDFTTTDADKIRQLIQLYILEYKAVRLQTESRSDEIIRKFHKFLGFTHEGVKRKMMFNQDYDMWAIVREGD